MIRLRKWMALLLALVMVMSLVPVTVRADSEHSINSEELIGEKQKSGSSDCVLYSNLYMERRRIYLEDSFDNAKSVDIGSFRKIAAGGGSSVYANFTYVAPDGISHHFQRVNMSSNGSGGYDIKKLAEKDSGVKAITGGGYLNTAGKDGGTDAEKLKQFLRYMLDVHKEGIVIWASNDSNNYLHAVLITDYDITNDTFYCADSLASKPKGRIKLTDSYLASRSLGDGTQMSILKYIWAIWYIDDPKPVVNPVGCDHRYKTVIKNGKYTSQCRICNEYYDYNLHLNTADAGRYKLKNYNNEHCYLAAEPYTEAGKTYQEPGETLTLSCSVLVPWEAEWVKWYKCGDMWVLDCFVEKVGELPKPSAPDNFTGIANPSGNDYTFSLSWDKVEGATSYKIEYKRPAAGTWQALKESPLSTNYVTTSSFSGISSYSSITFRVCAVNAAGSSEWAETVVPLKGTTTYTVTYNANGGTGAPAAQTKNHGQALTLSSAKPTRDNASAGSYTVTLNGNGGSVSPASLTAARTTSYSFKNWNTASNGSGTAYNPGASYTADANVTLYAQWDSSTATAAVTLPTPTRTGYTFKGWGNSASATSGKTGSYTPTGSETLYAVWEKVPVDLPTISVSSVTAKPGEEIALDVCFSNNPGVMVIQLGIKYDAAKLSFLGVTDSAFKGWSSSGNNILWIGDADQSAAGSIVKLRFKVAENCAEGDTAVTVTCSEGDVANHDEEPIAVSIEPGKVTVRKTIPGDLTGDGKINALDLLRLKKHLLGENVELKASADLTGDGKINALDLLRLKKYLLGESVVLNKVVRSTESVMAASGTPTLTVSSVTAEPGDTVTLDVTLGNNPGIMVFLADLVYDDALEFAGYEDAGITGWEVNASKAIWVGDEDYTADGAVLKLKFRVKDGAQSGTYSAGFAAADDMAFSESEKAVIFTCVAGKVTVGAAEGPKLDSIMAAGGGYTVSYSGAKGCTLYIAAYDAGGRLVSATALPAEGSGTGTLAASGAVRAAAFMTDANGRPVCSELHA